MLLAFIRRMYLWDDLVLLLARIRITRLIKWINLFLITSFGLFLLIYGYPAMKAILSQQNVYLERWQLLKRGNHLAHEYKVQLKEYRKVKGLVDRLMGIDTPYVNSKVFDTLVSLFHEIGVYDVYLKIGKVTEAQIENLKFILVPVQIKAYVEYKQLPKFFKILNQNLVYKMERLRIDWSPDQGKERVLLDIRVVFKYRNPGDYAFSKK